eukprot:574456-Pyramimonas_sp.AAC.1
MSCHRIAVPSMGPEARPALLRTRKNNSLLGEGCRVFRACFPSAGHRSGMCAFLGEDQQGASWIVEEKQHSANA